MANWQHTLDLKDLWDKYRNVPNPPYVEEGKEIAARIRGADFFDEFKSDLENIALLFEVAVDQTSFNFACDRLWDWGDHSQPTPPGNMQRKNCWIKTF